jgi:thiamine-monophosphate kinase
VAVTVALVGRAEIGDDGQPLLLRRDAACVGHVIAVTGWLGDSAAGLRRLREGAPADDPLAAAHLRPRPPLQTANVAARLGVPCGIDVSDGLLQDLGHVCRISGLAADLHADSLPLSPELRAAFPQEALALACGGGEDYEMVFVGPSDAVRSLDGSIEDRLTVIGEMREGPGRTPRLLDAAGNELSPVQPGWDHL